jgi:Anti-sigma-K factor rskA/Sigma-70, region 4
MPRLDDLPPDLRATLSLLVDRGKSYAQVAELLGIPESAVRDRAHAALDALAGDFSSDDAPPIPSAQRPQTAERIPAPSASGASPMPPVSRRGGALLLAGIAVVVIVVVLLTSGGGSGGSSNSGSSTHTGTSTSTSTSPGSKSTASTKTPKVTKQLTLTSPDPASKTIGIAEILAEGSQRAFYLAAEHLPPPPSGSSYVIWLYNSPASAEAISRAACAASDHVPSCPTVGSDGRLQGGALLPSNAGAYSHMLLTRETSEHPTTPGPVVLSGPFGLGS